MVVNVKRAKDPHAPETNVKNVPDELKIFHGATAHPPSTAVMS